jgi:hypothetical protein
MWPGWIAKFFSSHAAQLMPDRAQEILDKFLAGEHHAIAQGQKPKDGFV